MVNILCNNRNNHVIYFLENAIGTKNKICVEMNIEYRLLNRLNFIVL